LSRCLLLTALFCACTYENEQEQTSPSSPVRALSLLFSDPAPGQGNVGLDAPIDLFFGAPLDAESVAQVDVRLFSGLIEKLGVVSVDLLDRRIRFSHSTSLQPNLRYQVYLSTSFRGLNGARLKAPIIFDFTTGDRPQGSPEPAGTEVKAGELQPLWLTRCAAGCHEPPWSRTRVDLSTADAAARSLVNVPSMGRDMLRVMPQSHARSYLMLKLMGEGGTVGFPMPPEGPQLSREELRRVADWIDGGALP
jgi:hypothetical protein